MVGLYCDFLAQQEQSAANMLSARLKQLASRGGISKVTRKAFKKAKMEFGGRCLQLPEMLHIVTESAYCSRYCTYLMLHVSYLGSTIVALLFYLVLSLFVIVSYWVIYS